MRIPSVLALAFSQVACATTQRGLLSAETKRTCTGWYCYIEAPANLVNVRCTDRKSAWRRCQNNPSRDECRNAPARWDDGSPRAPGQVDRSARCCTVLRPKESTDRLRYWIWFSEGEAVCLAHEHGHIEVYERDGFRYVEANHRALHGFSLDREKRSLGAP